MISGRTFSLDSIQRLWSVERDSSNALGDLDCDFRHIVPPVRCLEFVARNETVEFKFGGWNGVRTKSGGDVRSYTRVGWR